MASYVKVAKASDLRPGQGKMITAGDKRIALFNDRGSFYALDDTCTHAGGPLSEGACEDGVVTCPWHAAQFRLRDGLVLGPPAPRNVNAYLVRVTDGEVEVEL